MNNQPFQTTKLEEEREGGQVFSVRINKQERVWLDEVKEDLNIKSDSKALKTAAFIGRNVTQAIFTRKLLKYLFKDSRVKLEE